MSEILDTLQTRRTKKGKKSKENNGIAAASAPHSDEVVEAEEVPRVKKTKKKRGIPEAVCSEAKQATQECPLREYPRKKKKRKRQMVAESDVVNNSGDQEEIESGLNVGELQCDVIKDEEVPQMARKKKKKVIKEVGCGDEVQAQSASEMEVKQEMEAHSAAQPRKKKSKRQVEVESNVADIGVKKKEMANVSNVCENAVEEPRRKTNNDFRMMLSTMMIAEVEVDNDGQSSFGNEQKLAQKVANGTGIHESGNANPIDEDAREHPEKPNKIRHSTALEDPSQTSLSKQSALERNDDDDRRDAAKSDGAVDATTEKDAEHGVVGTPNDKTGTQLLQNKTVAESEPPSNSVKICAANLPTSLDKTALWEHFERCGAVRDVYLLKDWYSQMSRGVCFVTFESHSGVQEALKMNDSELIGQKIRVNVAVDKPKGNKGKDSGKNSGKGSGKTNSCFALANHAFQDGKGSGKGKQTGKSQKGSSCGKGLGELSNPPVGCLGFIIKRLSFSVVEEDLKACFQACGNGPTRVRILKDNVTGNSKGKAFVDFADREALEEAAKMNNTELKGRRFVMEFTLPRGNDITDAAA